jgi:hypothetical protein
MSLILLRAVPMEKNLKELAKSADNPLSECDKKYHALFRNRSSPRPSFPRKRKIVVAVASTRHKLNVVHKTDGVFYGGAAFALIL